MSNTSLYQATPTAPVVEFSDKPIKVDGVKYYPKRQWSAGYRKWFRAGHSPEKTRHNPDDNTESYLLWLVKRHGLESIEWAKTHVLNSQGVTL